MSLLNAARAVLFVLTVGAWCSAGAQALFLNEFYSNADGTVQFVVLSSTGGPGTLVARSGSEQHAYTFPSNLPVGRLLAATRAFADLHSLEPDFVLPDSFLFTRSVRLGVGIGATAIIDLPTDGTHSLYADYDADIGSYATRAGSAVAVNNAGKVVALAPMDVADQVEYYNAGIDDYFLTSYPQEIDALDAGALPGWQRTGQTLPTFTGPAADQSLVPGMGPVCRVYAGNAHLYAFANVPVADGPSECFVASQWSGAEVETWNAFYAIEPDVVTGSCPDGQAPVYRLWNPRGAGHRYTTQSAIRDEMLRRGYVAEGYGPDAVTLCVANTLPQ